MTVSNQNLQSLKKQLEGDRERYVALLNQTIGGLLLIEHLEKSEAAHEPELSQNELEALVGGTIESIEPVSDENAAKPR